MKKEDKEALKLVKETVSKIDGYLKRHRLLLKEIEDIIKDRIGDR